jgi:hypothetical protein
MGTIYSGIQGIRKPSIKGNWKTYVEREEAYVDKVRNWAKENNPHCPEAGKEIRFSVADGYARYVVLSLKPVQLVHLATGDAWHFQYIDRLTAGDIRKEIKKVEALEKLFKVGIKNGKSNS